MIVLSAVSRRVSLHIHHTVWAGGTGVDEMTTKQEETMHEERPWGESGDEDSYLPF